MAQQSSLIFVSGGVRSGKSQFAEKLAADIWRQEPKNGLHYIASMQRSDGEMAQRITRHQEDRRRSGLKWQTWEKPVSIGELASSFYSHDVVLLDCLTTWLNNELFFSAGDFQDRVFLEQLFVQMRDGIEKIKRRVTALIIVSNEVLNEPIGDNDLILTYNRLLGRLHQAIVKDCREAYWVEMGIPVQMKGETRCGE
ncbi:bifunctional adenosylcobinamide kinase/adenosylcobinamide-phosphate guanylyltransferase [Bacillus benzoevorans]|uniref:Adenosylcobinamide kinase n=1 Tax=Bacillus benzoevorans TaxID=1456 RepID=A0A7X0HVS8_9BACI|nr:bifunctional adenosylcobinamide kinase/adenosylcobinamide-phosphate guanylyltransferase [Bacillus benzoevorans]MBB6447691.1 adenosylcobinamide kinase/adenosylcobinamide-phosphate guanylyltransferase [Bacillus benzoevorans]